MIKQWRRTGTRVFVPMPVACIYTNISFIQIKFEIKSLWQQKSQRETSVSLYSLPLQAVYLPAVPL
jgi:hypothetical protein